jgi:hypothetical protein
MLGTQDMAEEKFKKWEKEPQHMAGMVFISLVRGNGLKNQ